MRLLADELVTDHERVKYCFEGKLAVRLLFNPEWHRSDLRICIPANT
jgi:hypothetical protein